MLCLVHNMYLGFKGLRWVEGVGSQLLAGPQLSHPDIQGISQADPSQPSSSHITCIVEKLTTQALESTA